MLAVERDCPFHESVPGVFCSAWPRSKLLDSLLAGCAISPQICFVLTPALVALECEVGVLAVAVPIVSTAWKVSKFLTTLMPSKNFPTL